MVEDVRLDAFVLGPGHRVGEAVDLQRQPFRGGCHLAHQEGHALVDPRVAAQVALHIRTEGADVGDTPGIHRLATGFGQLGVPVVDLAALVDQVVLQQVEAIQPLALLAVQEVDALLVDQQAALDAPAA
ncbi:hypothetical protein D3C77_582840 [compost metagenome]